MVKLMIKTLNCGNIKNFNYWYHEIQKSNKLDFIVVSRGHVIFQLLQFKSH